jgi:hypothetical protein
MKPKQELPPPIAPETMKALLAATTEFAAAKLWEEMCDSDVVGLIDQITGETRLACVLGNGGEVFGLAVYRRSGGIRWILNMLNDPEKCLGFAGVEGMDALKVEFLPKNQLLKEDLAALEAVDFKPAGRGLVWPQFQSTQPGYMPWFIDQSEAEQLLADLQSLTKFAVLFHQHRNLFDNRPPSEIPFLPNPMPNRPLQLENLDWRPMIALPETVDPFKATEEQLTQLHSLNRESQSTMEYGCMVLPGAIMENGRPCYSRISLLVEHRRGLMLGFKLALGTKPYTECAGSGLVQSLIKCKVLPGKILIDDERLESILGPVCDELKVKLVLSEELQNLADAKASLDQYMLTGPR